MNSSLINVIKAHLNIDIERIIAQKHLNLIFVVYHKYLGAFQARQDFTYFQQCMIDAKLIGCLITFNWMQVCACIFCDLSNQLNHDLDVLLRNLAIKRRLVPWIHTLFLLCDFLISLFENNKRNIQSN